jgi:hypothetical protein
MRRGSRETEEKVYVWSEYAHGDGRELENAEIKQVCRRQDVPRQVRQGSPHPVWPIDIVLPQAGKTQAILGYLLADAMHGTVRRHQPGARSRLIEQQPDRFFKPRSACFPGAA